jgi:hypothetical protein
LKAENVMAEEKKWLNYMAITTVLVAVCATLSTFKGGGFSTRALLNQSKASDQWAYYQSKSIKGYINEMQKDNFEVQLLTTTNLSVQAALKSKIAMYNDKISKYAIEKEKAKEEAQNFEGIRDESKKHSEAFGTAVIFLQMSILLSSIAALSKKKPVWLISIVLGVVGAACFANGFWLFF